MALTVNYKPFSARLDASANTTYSIIDNGSGKARLAGGSGLTNGDLILIVDSLESYNGLWFYSSSSALRDVGFVIEPTYYQDFANAKVYRALDYADWHSVHLPILYGINTDKFPFNVSEFTRSITAFGNNNGYVKLTLSGVVDAEVLDFLLIAGSSVDELDGPFQILTKHSTSQFTINAPYLLAFQSPYTYLGATAVKYYNNYHVRTRIFAGLPTIHQWNSVKPIELVTELRNVPEPSDSPSYGGIVNINVAEAVKQMLNISKNTPNADTIPYDLDRFTFFYISVAESYDVQGEEFVGDYTTLDDEETFPPETGYAIDAILEFKNLNSGALGDYLFGDSSNLAKFLTYADRPSIFPGNYFDLSFIKGTESLALVTINYDAHGNLIDASNELIDATSRGVIRCLIEAQCSQGYKLVQLFTSIVVGAPSAWTRQTSGVSPAFPGDYPIPSPSGSGIVPSQAWTATVNGWTRSIDSATFVYYYMFPSSLPAGSVIPSFDLVLSIENAGASVRMIVDFLGAGGDVVMDSSTFPAGTSITASTTAYTTTDVVTGVRILISAIQSPSGTWALDISDLLATAFPTDVYSEQKRIDVDCNCGAPYIYLTWKNALGGFDYWMFKGNKDYNIVIPDTQERNKNIIPSWPKSYGKNADTISYEASRTSRREMVVRSQNLTREQLDFITGIKTSSLVQQLTSQYDRRTVIVDKTTLKVRSDGDVGPYSIEFTIRETNNIAAQSL